MNPSYGPYTNNLIKKLFALGVEPSWTRDRTFYLVTIVPLFIHDRSVMRYPRRCPFSVPSRCPYVSSMSVQGGQQMSVPFFRFSLDFLVFVRFTLRVRGGLDIVTP